MSSTLILVGLGNPTSRYEWTRHNVGFHVLEALAGRYRARWVLERPNYTRADVEVGGVALVLVKPMTFVNRSGRAVASLAGRSEIDPANLLVIVDDIALPWGRLRLRRHGSNGGHNGLRSIEEYLGTPAFPRLRIGVGPVPPEVDPADFVLEPMPRDLKRAMEGVNDKAVACIEAVVAGGFDRAMSLFNVAEPESD